MADPASLAPPARKPAGPAKVILIGCGVLTTLFILGMGGCAGIFYLIYQGSEPVAKVGSDYLSSAPEMTKAFGGSFSIQRSKLGWNVSVVNDGGHARFTYSIRREKANEIGEAVVWLIRSGGTWKAVGAQLVPHAGDGITIGEPPREERRSEWD